MATGLLALALAVAGCGLGKDMAAVKKLNDALESEVGGDPSVNYSAGTDGKVIKVKFFGALKDPDTAAATTRRLVDAHIPGVDELEIWKCDKKPSGIETCIGM